jgi:hypothetical protein
MDWGFMVVEKIKHAKTKTGAKNVRVVNEFTLQRAWAAETWTWLKTEHPLCVSYPYDSPPHPPLRPFLVICVRVRC